MQKLNSLDCV